MGVPSEPNPLVLSLSKDARSQMILGQARRVCFDKLSISGRSECVVRAGGML